MTILDKLQKISDLISGLTSNNDLILKNRFRLTFAYDTSKIYAASTDPKIISNKLLVNIFPWDKYVQQVSSPVKGKVLKPVKYSDLYDYIDSFENNRFIDVTFAVLDFTIVQAVQSWLELVYDKGFGYYDDYACFKMKLHMIPYSYQDGSVWPIEVGGIEFGDVYPVSARFSELDHSHNTIYNINVQFAFKTMKIVEKI